MADRIYPISLPEGQVFLAWDGSDWRVVKCDTDHHLQVDVLESALPTGGATEATLANILTELEAKLETADLHIDAGTKDLEVDVTESALPTGAATEATLAEVEARIGDETSPASGSVNKQLADILAEVLLLTDIRYQGDHIVRKAGSATTTTGTATTIVEDTVGTGKIWYIYAFGSSADSLTEKIDLYFQVAGSTKIRSFYQIHSPVCQGVCFEKATAGQTVRIRCKQDSGGDLLVLAYFIAIEQDA